MNFYYEFIIQGDLVNYNINLKCEVCGAVTRLRVQAGWLDSHPIRINCGTCGILIASRCDLDQINGTMKFVFDNANPCGNNPNYYIESSGELITLKLKSYDNNYFMPPFFNAMHSMNDDMGIFKRNIVNFLNDSKEKWHIYRRVLDLSKNNQHEYLKQEIYKLLPERLYPCDNDLERLRAVHFLIFRMFYSLHDKEFIGKTMTDISSQIIKLDTKKLEALIRYYKDNNDMLSRYSEKVVDILNEFVSVFQFLIPAYGLTFYKDRNIDFSLYGTTTCSFEDIKQFYLDAYEVIGDIILLPIGLNNIFYRGDFEKINDKMSSSPKVKKYYDLFKVTKGERSKFIDLNELFCKVTKIKLNGKLRNAIGHNDYTYNGITQEITYIPNSAQPNKKEHIYLIEFALECIQLIKGIIMIDEIIYQVRKCQYLYEGCKPKIEVKDILKKVGRNELCPCGSEKKYKKCHGK